MVILADMKALILILIFSSSLSFAHEVTIKVTNMRSQSGKMGVLVFNKAQGFPKDDSAAISRGFYALDELPLKMDLPTGTYALSIFQDINQNSRLDTNGLQIPKEPFGFSRNPAIAFGPPKFKKASFKVTGSKTVVIKLKHF